LVRLVLASAGLDEIRVRIDGDTLLADATGVLNQPVSTVAAFMSIVPISLTTLRMTWAAKGHARSLVVPLDLMRAYMTSSEDETGKSLRFWELCSAALLDHQAVLRPDGLRKLAAVTAAGSMDLPIGDSIRRARSIREAVLRIGDQECADVLRRFIRFLRDREMGEEQDPEAQRALEQIVAWGESQIKEPFRQ
jgi:hypothetical protein